MPTHFERLFNENPAGIVGEAPGVDLSVEGMKKKYDDALIGAAELQVEYLELIKTVPKEGERATLLRFRINNAVSTAQFWDGQAKSYYGDLIARIRASRSNKSAAH